MRISRILMNAVDSGSGGSSAGSAPPSTPPIPNEVPAQPAPVQLDEATRNAIAQVARDSYHAERRRTEQAPEKKNKTQPNNDPPPSANFRALDRAVANRNLSESAYKRLESAFAAENPDNVGEWVKDYFEGFGATAPNAASATGGGTPNASPGNAIPASGGSPPPPPKVPVEERKIIGAPQAEVEYLTKTRGVKWVAAKYRAELATMKVSLKK